MYSQSSSNPNPTTPEMDQKEQKHANDNVLLVRTIKVGEIDKAKHLIEEGADLEVQDEDGDTPLIAAVRRGEFFLVLKLLKKGIDVNVLNYHAENALLVAVKSNYPFLVELILDQHPKKIFLPKLLFRLSLQHSDWRIVSRLLDEEKLYLEEDPLCRVSRDLDKPYAFEVFKKILKKPVKLS